MAQQLSPDVVYHSYALLRRGEHKWDGWYDVLLANGRPLRTFVRVPSREGFDDPELACQAAEILAQWDLTASRPAARR